MTKDNLKCFGCGGKGHMERDCPSAIAAADGPDDKPMWCGRCDRRTRLIMVNGTAYRCQECHPLAHQGIPQTTRCAGCRTIVYRWDRNPCGQHAAPEQPDNRLPREEIDAIVARESEVARRYDPHGEDAA